MSENLLNIYKGIKDSFCSILSYKMRGNTIEVITPFTTPTDKFISAFITTKNDSYIITDGGWLMSGEYMDGEIIKSEKFKDLLNFFQAHYSFKILEQGKNTYYYKTTNDQLMIANAAHDIGQFISQILTAYFATLEQEKLVELKENQRFNTSVDNYINGLVYKKNIKFRQKFPFNEEHGIRFNAVVLRGNNVSLIKYVTGAEPDYFIKNLTKATVDFEIIDDSSYRNIVDSKIVMLNDSARGFNEGHIYTYLQKLEDIIGRPITRWSKKEELEQIL